MSSPYTSLPPCMLAVGEIVRVTLAAPDLATVAMGTFFEGGTSASLKRERFSHLTPDHDVKALFPARQDPAVTGSAIGSFIGLFCFPLRTPYHGNPSAIIGWALTLIAHVMVTGAASSGLLRGRKARP